MVTALALAPSETIEALKTLFASGLIDMNQLETSAFLTPEGYAVVSDNDGTHSGP
jgi:hypothetical protein